MKYCSRSILFLVCELTAFALLSACGGHGHRGPSYADTSDVKIAGANPGATPFISFIQLSGSSLKNVSSIRYIIEPMAGTASKPVSAQYTLGALERRGFAVSGGDIVTLPVFGLYASRLNQVSVKLSFIDQSVQNVATSILTAVYNDPSGIYDQVNILKRRSAGSAIGFDFIAVKSALGTPIVVDTDGLIRWVGVGIADGFTSVFEDNAFVIGDRGSTRINRLELDGSIGVSYVISPRYTNFHHNIDHGKQGLLAEMDSMESGIKNQETIIAEITATGTILKEWNFASLLRTYMGEHGDDPDAFVRPGVDWFHSNASTYDPSDDTLIVSSRENFIIKVDYRTGNIIWILGDPTKYWYSFPSLRAKALSLEAGGLYPIGQHATSITSDGLLMVFNDGFASVNQPTGASAGENRTYSAVSAYSINPITHVAREVWRFDYGQSIFSPVCSSAYEASGKSVLVNYAVASDRAKARLVGLNGNHDVVFDFEYANNPAGCFTSWNAVPIGFENLEFT